MKKLIALFVALMMLVSVVALADTYTSNTLNLKSLIRATVVVPVEEEQPAEEQPAEEQPAEEKPNYQVTIQMSHDGDKVHIGDTVTLVAVLSGYENTAYQLQWQCSDDGETWTDIEGQTSDQYSFVITKENSKKIWGVAVTTVDAE